MCSTLHWYPEDVPAPQLAATMVGMANCDGGSIILGISPKTDELVGIYNGPAAIEKVFQAAILAEPSLVLPMARQLRAQRPGLARPVTLFQVNIPPGLPHVYSLEGRYLGREGALNVPIPSERLYKLMNERGAIKFESLVVAEAGLEDLELDQVQAYAENVGNVEHADLEKSCEFLVRRGCLKKAGNRYLLTYAAILLFGKSPQQWLPNATILAGRFPGSSLSDSYIKQDIQGNLPKQLRQAEEFIRLNLKNVVRLVGLTHEERLEYPFEAVRELLVNAVAHRDYNLQGDCTHLNIYSDRLVLSSPGSLPGPVTLENLLVARFARNAIISQVLSDLGYVERLGYGIDRVVSVCRAEGMPSPRFEEVAGTFQVTLYANLPGETAKSLEDLSIFADEDLNPRQQAALAQLARHKRITSHEYQALCPDVHAETIRRDLADLVSKGILIKVGDKKATYYILKKV